MRARNIKPGFFANEDLAELPFEGRLLYIGLWCMADRAGRLEDRPKRIAMKVFPADAVNVDELLDGLAEKGLIVRYQAGGIKCIEIPKFLDHQSPHYTEKASVLPPRLPESFGHDDPCTPGALPEDSRNDTYIKRGPLPPDSLNPDSPNPDSSPDTSQQAETSSGTRTRSNGSRNARSATRLPDDFELTEHRRQYAKQEGLAPERTFAKFVDYWRAAAGAKARKLDWDATWRNWCRTEADRNGKAPTAATRERRLTRYEEIQAVQQRAIEEAEE